MKVEKYDFYALDTITLRSDFADSLNVLLLKVDVAYNEFCLATLTSVHVIEYMHVVNCIREVLHVVDFLAVNKLLKRKVYENIVDYVSKIQVELKDYED